ncbi:gamma-glutamyltransferase [Bradyrhizobium sp. LHD-71]|uniref:gamma-glutamyltransferase n=1 Tax=Bradyrhizobium sp. LHD-71 TaxID=3072141 RepID=UPI00280DB434|nr:gamma-glutamyltransferase [Bradyrhizobium sp. LHD-71]MDQ8728303.1 gamma-glutamyltransferase [Bradyrhizobium sp. LHD-71]
MARPQLRRPRYRAMIVAPQPEAAEAGHVTLEAGGNALDAVIACALAQGVVDPLMCGLGGLGSLHIFDPKQGESLVFDGLSTCPAACTPGMWQNIFEKECDDGYGFVLKGGVNEIGHTAVTTPGIVRVFGDAHRTFGRLPWAELFHPAVSLAEEGWVVRPHVAMMFALNETKVGRIPYAKKLAHTADGRKLYLHADGAPKRLGDAVTNPDLADTLRMLARHGAESFYTGEIAKRMADDMAANGGLMTLDDLKSFKVRRNAPLTIRYRGRTIAMPPPPAGGIYVAQILRTLERFDLTGLEHNGAEYIAVVAEAMKIAGVDKDRFIGDPDFTEPPLGKLLSDAYAEECAARIRSGEKTPLARTMADYKNTTTVSCIDADGMVVSLTHTNGTPSGVIPPGLGFMLNGAMNWYDPRPGRASSIAPGKRRFSSMTPTIVFEDRTPVFTVGAPGGAWIGPAVLQVLVNVLDWGMPVADAVAAPRFSATSDAIDISNRIPRRVQRALEARGYEVRRSPLSYPFAAPHGISCWDGVLEGGADPQRDGYAAGMA